MKNGFLKTLSIFAGLYFVLVLILIPTLFIYGNKTQRDVLLYLCSIGSCVAGIAALFISFQTGRDQQELIKAITNATEEIQKLRIAITDNGKITNTKK